MVGRDENRIRWGREQWKENVWGEITGLGAFAGQYGNLVPWRLPGTYKSDPDEES